jgi:hypothetical protein
MNNALKILALVALSLIVVGALIAAGFFLGRSVTQRQAFVPDTGGFAAGPGMMLDRYDGELPYGGGMMPGWGCDELPFAHPMMPGQRFDRRGMMDDFGRMPMFGGGPAAGAVEPLTVEATTEAVQAFLDNLGKDNLALGEIMVFDNHAYAVIEDTTTGQGAFEVLVDPARQVVHLEYGPSMMWNTVYGMHGSDPIFGAGRMPGGRMMGGLGPEAAPTSDTPLTEAEARQKAQAHVEAELAGQTLSATAEAFPGYYTFDLEQDGAPSGMLSVNASTGQVWFHSWHGTFIEMSE